MPEPKLHSWVQFTWQDKVETGFVARRYSAEEAEAVVIVPTLVRPMADENGHIPGSYQVAYDELTAVDTPTVVLSDGGNPCDNPVPGAVPMGYVWCESCGDIHETNDENCAVNHVEFADVTTECWHALMLAGPWQSEED